MKFLAKEYLQAVQQEPTCSWQEKINGEGWFMWVSRKKVSSNLKDPKTPMSKTMHTCAMGKKRNLGGRMGKC